MNAVVPYREERFKAMLDVLEALMPTDFSTLDIGCGPGSFSKRLLERFSRTKCIAVDFDPVFLKIGQSALGSMDGRLEWIDMNILEPKWLTRVGLGQVNAVVSTSAFHNLTTGQIIDTYRGIALLLRPGDVFLNADLLPFSHTLPTFNLLTEKAYSRDQNGRFDQLDMDVSEGWMSAFERMEPDLLPLMREREHRRNEWGTPGRIRTTIDMHEAALQEAGFREVGVVWQRLDHRVVMAVR
jgi:trans-aconitate methyltransferase